MSNGSRLALSFAWSMVFLTAVSRKLSMDGIEPVERHQDADLLQGHRLARRLEGVEHRPLATGQVQARGPGLADRLEDLLDQLELVRGEGVVLDEVVGVLERLEGHAAVREGELVLEDVALLGEEPLQVRAATSGRLASRRDWMTSSTLALESDSRVLKRP